MTLRIGANSTILGTQLYAMFQWDPDTTTGLTFGYLSGYINTTGTNPLFIAAGTVVLTDDTTNYVYATTSAIETAIAIPVDAEHLLHEVVTASGVITSVTDKRDTY